MKKITLLVLLLNTWIVYAEPDVNTQTEYYTVDGETAQDIREDMNSKRSGDYDAYTEWHVKWHFRWKSDDQECHLTSVTTSVDVKFNLPKLAKDTIANEDAKHRWKRYYRALIDHENGHRDFGVKAANEVEYALSKMGSRRSCTTLENDANKLGKEIVRKFNAQEKQYDIDTRHGMNDGAVFP